MVLPLLDHAHAVWVKLLCFFDLTTGEKPSFSKLMCVALFVALTAMGELSLGVVIALLAASFGRSVFLAFLNRSSVQATETREFKTVEIQERRDAAQGVEPT
jgi:hypothetical protein